MTGPIGPKPEIVTPMAPTPWRVGTQSSGRVFDANGNQVLSVDGDVLSSDGDHEVAAALVKIVNQAFAPTGVTEQALPSVAYLVDGTGDYWFELDGQDGFILSSKHRDSSTQTHYEGAQDKLRRGVHSSYNKAEILRVWGIRTQQTYTPVA